MNKILMIKSPTVQETNEWFSFFTDEWTMWEKRLYIDGKFEHFVYCFTVSYVSQRVVSAATLKDRFASLIEHAGSLEIEEIRSCGIENNPL